MNDFKRKIEKIMRGEASAGALYPILSVAEKAYSFGAGLKNTLYDWRLISPAKPGCRVISVGNISVGGSGKTPFTMLLAKKLLAMGRRPAVLSRGYGVRISGGFQVVSYGNTIENPPPFNADEPYMMAKNLPGVPVICAPKRIVGAKVLANILKVDTILLDDGFQHRALHRDLNIVILPSRDPFGSGHLLPLGVLRESPAGLRRADVVVITGVDSVPPDMEREMRRYCKPDVVMITARGEITGFCDLDDKVTEPSGAGFAMCGIAEPSRFTQSLAAKGVGIAGFAEFPDHHMFSADEIKNVLRRAGESGAAFIVTTEKDATRLLINRGAFDMPVVYARYAMRITSSPDELDGAIARALSSGG